ncbi:hypothetical protein [Roseimicrobium sp. ORNL1]|uniref:hypothetical protein n=1 Tax=Roseimicrobium sp. ORNL1 TaxID=2711231 RepID=UPI0013E147C7|nr:hypothetical protein [Roseimicrobium sp. ORNL1]QIF01530.1 hypothetical protein G5S37_08340 [Roseimicrobium sp. ORNL1]
MKPLSFFAVACLAFALLANATAFAQAPAATESAKKPLAIVLKLDDLVKGGKPPTASVSPRFQRTADFLEGEKLKYSYGILSDSLEGDCPAYVDWIKEHVAKGYLEIWHHGYYARLLPPEMKVNGRTAEYMGGTPEEQAAMFRKSIDLVKQKTGIEMMAFGPHSTAIDGTTYKALDGIPEIKMVFYYGPPKGVTTSKFVVQRLMELEKPLFVPNPENVQKTYETKKDSVPYFVIQGHPNQWDDARFENFKKAVLYLRDQGCRFLTPSELLKEQTTAK